MKFKKLFVVLFLSLFFAVSPATASDWEFAGWHGGGCYPNLTFDPHVQGRVYLTSDVVGIWRSDDLGENWKFITHGLDHLNISSIEVAPSDPNILYATSLHGIFASKDAGENWKKCGLDPKSATFLRPESFRPVAVSSSDSAKLIAGNTKGDVFMSENGGESWGLLGGKKPFGTESVITAVTWAQPDKVWVSSGKGLAFFTFSKGAWENLKDSPKEISDFWVEPAQGQLVLAAGQNKLFVSKDAGLSWQFTSLIPSGVIYRLQVLDATGQKILAAWNDGWKGGVISTEDQGQLWKPWDKEMTADIAADPTRSWAAVHGRINSLKVDPFDPQVWFRTDWWGVWRSQDGGVTWTEKIRTAPNTVTSDIQLSPKGDLYVATMDNGLLKSSDGGQTYEAVFPKKGYRDDMNGHVWRVAFLGQDKVIATSSPWNADQNQVAVIQLPDYGFKLYKEGLPAKKPRQGTVWNYGYPKAIAVHPQDPDQIYIAIDGEGAGLFLSKDGGQTWKRSASQPPSPLKIYNALALDPANPKKIFIGTMGYKGGVYLSEDDGASWKHVCKDLKKVFDIAIGREGKMYAAGEGAQEALIYWSQDGGATWSRWFQKKDAGTAEALCVLPDGRVTFSTQRWGGFAGGQLYLSSADGKDIRNITAGLPHGEGASSMVYDAKSGTLYAARYAGSVYRKKLEI